MQPESALEVFGASSLYTELAPPRLNNCLTSPSLKLLTGTCVSCTPGVAAGALCSFFLPASAALAGAAFCAAALAAHTFPVGAGEGTDFAAGAAGAGEAFEDRDCCGVRAAPGRGRAHAPRGSFAIVVFY